MMKIIMVIVAKLDGFRLKMFVMALVLLLGGCLSKNHMPQAQSGALTVCVMDFQTGEAIPGVDVTIASHHLTTDNEGKAILPTLTPGDYQMVLQRPWYVSRTVQVHFVGVTTPITIQLQCTPMSGKIIYSSDQDGNREIYQLDLMLPQRLGEKLFEFPDSSESQPCPMGPNRIVYQSTQLTHDQYNNDIFCFDLSSRTQRLIYQSPANDQHPSADNLGRRLVFQIGRAHV